MRLRLTPRCWCTRSEVCAVRVPAAFACAALTTRRYRREIDGVESTGAALMAAGIPSDLVLSGQRFPSLDWRSRLDVWRAV